MNYLNILRSAKCLVSLGWPNMTTPFQSTFMFECLHFQEYQYFSHTHTLESCWRKKSQRQALLGRTWYTCLQFVGQLWSESDRHQVSSIAWQLEYSIQCHIMKVFWSQNAQIQTCNMTYSSHFHSKKMIIKNHIDPVSLYQKHMAV